MWVVQVGVRIATANHGRSNRREAELLLHGSGRVEYRVVVEVVCVQSERYRSMMLWLWGQRSWLAGRVEPVVVERRFVCGALGRNAAVGDWWNLRRCLRSSLRRLKKLAKA